MPSGSITPLERFQGLVSYLSFSSILVDMHLPHMKSFAEVIEQVRVAFRHEKESEAHQVLTTGIRLSLIDIADLLSADFSTSFP